MYTIGYPKKAQGANPQAVMPFEETAVEDAVIVEEKEEEVGKTVPTPSQPQQPQPQAQAADLGMFGNMFSQSIETIIKQKAEDMRPEVVSILKDELQKLKPTNVRITGRKGTGVVEGYTHKHFREAVFLSEQERQLMMVGPAGSGKTTLAKQIAKAFEIPFTSISCYAGMSEAHLLGRMLFDGTYVPSDFITAYENGGVFLFDEIDAADSNTLLVVNSALANGYVSVPNRKDKPHAQIHEDFICVVAGNSWGHGSAAYQGRGSLDAAFLDRFSVAKLNLDYDESLELELGDSQIEVVKRMHQIRKIVTSNRLKRIVSTRTIVSAVSQAEAGRYMAQIESVFTTDWAEDDKRKIKK